MLAASETAPQIRIIPPVIFGAALAVAFLVDLVWPIRLLPNTVRFSVGAALIIASIAVMPPVLLAFARAETPFDVRRPAARLVTDGPYRYSRNPAYVSMIGLCLAIAVIADNVWVIPALLIATALLYRFVVLAEEQHLEGRFGDDYRRYKARVRRWI